MIKAKMQERIEKRLAEREAEALLVYSDGSHSLLVPSYLHYVTGTRAMGPSAVLISRDGRAKWLLEPAWDQPRVAPLTWIENVRGTSNLCRDLIVALREFCPAGQLAVCGTHAMAEDLYASLESRVKLTPADDLIEEIAREKTADEVALLWELGAIADVGAKALLEHARPGVREFELMARIEHAMRLAGADDNFLLISSGPHNHEMHEPTDRILQKGDIVIGEITPGKDAQFVQLCRTMVLGKPSEAVASTYDMLLAALREALAEVRADSPANLMSKAMNGVISKAGYAKFCYPPYMRARGHGFGVGTIAPGGTIEDDTAEPFRRNDAVVVHPNQYLEATGYLACGETVLVTKAGFERLSKTVTRLESVEV
jgi:Xaa-Pro aminopeptidase